MKTIEDIFQTEKNQFDNFEPNEGHFERFEQRLAKLQPKNKTKKLSFFMRMAAIGLVLITLSVVGYKQFYSRSGNNPAIKNEINLSDISPEYKEVENYLKSNVNSKIKELEKISCSKNDNAKGQVINELNNIDTIYRQLQGELKQNTKNEKIINAMINCYQMKVEVLNQVIKQLNKNC